MEIHKRCVFINISASVSPSPNTHVEESACNCVCLRVWMYLCMHGYLHVFLAVCVQHRLKQIQQKVFVILYVFPPLWFALTLIPHWGLILVCCLGGETLTWYSKAWQEGRKHLAPALLACHWCMPLGAMCHILQLTRAAFLEKAPNNAVQIRANLQDGILGR